MTFSSSGSTSEPSMTGNVQNLRAETRVSGGILGGESTCRGRATCRSFCTPESYLD
uniref:Uncharacterized protein n=1 Tax=Zea mays TaxID=4577 RepID=B4FJ23_MAIZE|nr:unknown [Zea mays]